MLYYRHHLMKKTATSAKTYRMALEVGVANISNGELESQFSRNRHTLTFARNQLSAESREALIRMRKPLAGVYSSYDNEEYQF